MTDVEPICPHCGRPREPVGADAVPTGSRRGLVLLVAAACAVGAAALVLLPGTDDPPPPPAAADPSAPDRPSRGDDRSPVDPAVDLPPTDLTLSAGTRAAYASAEGLVIVEIESGQVDLAGVALTSAELAYVDPFILVADDRRTLAVHPAAPQEPFVLASNYRLVATSVPEQYVFVPAAPGLADADEVFLGQAQDGSFGRPVTLPPGSSRLAASGVGVLVAAPDGATYEVGLGGLEQVSEANVIAAAGRHRLEVRCDARLACRTDVVDELGGSVSLPGDVAGQLGSPVLSPDGRWVAGRNGVAIVLMEVGTGTVREIPVEDAVFALAWAPDSDLLTALMGPRDEARLLVIDVEGESTMVDLDGLGAPAPIGAGLVTF